MRYLIAFIVPPLAIALCKRWGHFVVNLIFFILSVPLCFFGVGVLVWVICIAHALAVCKVSSIDKRIDRMVKAIEGRTRTVTPSVADEPRSI
jgi:uncharacterized membrane protein YqaE (UPF0057 family)